MKIKTTLIMFLVGLIAQGALAGVVTKDPGFTSSVMLVDFSGTANASYGMTRLVHDSTGAGMGNYSYAVQAGTEGYAWFHPSSAWDPDVHKSVRVRMSSDRGVTESGTVDVFGYTAGPGVVYAGSATASAGTTLGEYSFNFTPPTSLDGTVVRVDPFNYGNSTGTDYWKVDYIMADMGVSRGAEMDSDADASRFVITGIGSTSVAGGIYSGTATSTDPNLHIQGQVAVDADFYKYAEIRMKAESGSEVQWFWRTDASGGYVAETLDASSDGGWHTYLVDMSGEADWTGQTTANRLDPTNLNGSDFEVDYVRFLSVIPEPTTLALLVPFAGLMLARRFFRI